MSATRSSSSNARVRRRPSVWLVLLEGRQDGGHHQRRLLLLLPVTFLVLHSKQALSLLPPYYSPNERGRGAAGSLHSARRSPQTPRRSPQKFRCQLLRRVNFNWLVLRIEKNEYGDNIKCTPGSLARLSFHLSAAQKRSLLRQVCIVCKYQKWHSGYILLSPGFKTIRSFHHAPTHTCT